MAPAISTLRGRTRDMDELASLLRHRASLVTGIVRILKERKKRINVLATAREATFRFFESKLDYLMRNGEIEHLLGVSDETFRTLLTICKPGACTIPNHVRLAVFLKFCREGISQNALSRYVGLSQPTVSRIVVNCIRDIVKVAAKYIKFPETKEELQDMRNDFSTRKEFGVPCFSVMDGKHWRCDHPPHTGRLNYNYKAFYSFNSLFLSDADSRILYIQLSKLGINSDAQLFRDGPLGEILAAASEKCGVTKLPGSDTLMPAFTLADNGFGLSRSVMTPYRENQLKESSDLRFNEIMSATRVKVENLFGIMTSKFQVFARNLRLDPENSRALIIACSVIHNISLGERVLTYAPYRDDPPIANPYRTPEEQRTALKCYLLSL